MHLPRELYTRDHIVKAGRAASWRRGDDSPALFHYDGINFWCVTGDRRRMTDCLFTPREGWCHLEHCTCEGCRQGGQR